MFWGYLMWAQFLVIWYGNIPEETYFVWYRLWGPWRPVGATVFTLVFVVPFLGLLGVTINTLACALIAREAYPAKSWPRYVGTVIALTSFYGSLSIGLRPASRLAYLYGGLWFYAFPILGALFLPLALIAAVRLTGRRSTPIVLLIVGLAVGTIGVNIARIGFEIVQPISVIEDEIGHEAAAAADLRDVDVIDRSQFPAAPGARAGGMAVHDFFAAVRRLASDARVRLIDLTEWDPPLDATDLSALTAARWLADILVRDDRVPAHARS